MAGSDGGRLSSPNPKMEEVQPDTNNGVSINGETNPDLTIPTDQFEDALPKVSSSGKTYKYGLTLEEQFTLSLDYYKKGTLISYTIPCAKLSSA